MYKLFEIYVTGNCLVRCLKKENKEIRNIYS